MSTLTLTSPGVQINEIDLSLIARPIGSTDILATGFAAQGPTEEFVNISSISEFEQVFGAPTNAAERYLYHSSKQILNASPGNLIVNRLPYGSSTGIGYANSYSALVYPVETLFTFTSAQSGSFANFINNNTNVTSFSSWTSATSASINTIINTGTYYASSINAGVSSFSAFNTFTTDNSAIANYRIGAPVSILLSEDQYALINSNGVNWNNTLSYSFSSTDSNGASAVRFSTSAVTSFNSIANAGLVVINTAKTSVNDLYEGYYVGLCDNSNINPSTTFNAVTGMQSISTVTLGASSQAFTSVPPNRLNFQLSAANAFGKNSISQVLEDYPTGYDFSSVAFQDSLILVLFKIRTSIYQQDTVTLDYVVSEGYAGSLYANRSQNNPNGGSPSSFYLADVVNKKSSKINLIVNPYISKLGTWINSDGTPAKQVRVREGAKNIYASGVYIAETDTNSKDVGDVSAKLQRVLTQLQNSDEINLDITIEAGLGTINASANARKKSYPSQAKIFDDEYYLDLTGGLLDTTGTASPDTVWSDYLAISNQFTSLANDTRKDHIFIADPIRNIFVQGKDAKTSSSKTFVFSNQIYWPLKNLFNSLESSYVTTYGNWIKVNDTASDTFVWVPFSGWAAASIATASQVSYPWSAVAGFTRGTLTNVIDIAVNPTQKQRDLIYKINVNPVAYFPGDGYVIYGQKTQYSKPSAFDRLNVRRLFLTLEKQTQALLKYFVFEPNTFSTRQRLIGALSPIFDKAKINDGLYDYTIVCDERNNTPDVIDNNQLNISIYIQPVRTAEFILCDFIATRTGIDFNELIG